MRLIPALLLAMLAISSAGDAQVGALQTDCALGGKQGDGTYQFVATCAGEAWSPDGTLAVVQQAYSEVQPPVEIRDRQGRTMATLAAISDDMPFRVSWAPNSQRLYINHHVGSFMGNLHLFKITGGAVVEDKALIAAAVQIAVTRYPCLPPEMVLPNGAAWSADSRRLVIATVSAPYACSEFGRQPGTFHSLWMIGNVETGQVDSATVRVQPDDGPFEMPVDGPYAQFK